MASKKRLSLSELMKRVGFDHVLFVRRDDRNPVVYEARATDAGWRPREIFLRAPTRRSTEAGLRAALEALPPVRAKGKR